MSRRGSACALVGMFALVNSIPLRRNDSMGSTTSASSVTCVEGEAPLSALYANGDDAQTFCKEYIPWSDPFAGAAAPSTVTVGSATVTSMVVSTLTVVYTVAEDYVVSVTSTQVCPNGATSLPVVTNSAVTTAPVAAANPTPAPNPRHGGRRNVQPPDYVASYQPDQISSACNCLSMKVVATPAAADATGAPEAVTSTVPVVTQMFTTVGPSPIVSYNRIGATLTAVAISCVAG